MSTTVFSTTWTRQHLVDARTLTVDDINQVMAVAKKCSLIFEQPIKKAPWLAGKVVANLFYENSTRTRTSFELAAKYLSAEVVNFNVSTSSVQKGETLVDTAESLAAMGTDCLVIRHASSGVCHQLAKHFGARIAIINAGDGTDEHPSQALLDLYTMQEKLGTVAGKKIVIVGDVLHSRVARSNIHVLGKMGAQVHLVGPSTLLPMQISELGCQVHTSLEEALKQADVVMCLRLQLERQTTGLIPSLGEYRTLYGIDREKLLAFTKPDVVVMHPGPMNRGVEISSDIADDPNISLIKNQVKNGVVVRMALLQLLLGDLLP